LANGKKGSADLCAYFFLRVGQMLREDGMAGLLATNTLAQGDTREVGLDQLASAGFRFLRANPSRPWPGVAKLEVAHVWLRRGDWQGAYVLDDHPVGGITSFLTAPGTVQGKPFKLVANSGKSFQGSNVLGMGFVLDPEAAHALLEKDPRNRDVLFPYLNGEDLNSRWDQSSSRWVINYRDWPLERSAIGSWAKTNEEGRAEYLRVGRVPADYPDKVAADYPACLDIVERLVKPERAKNNDRLRREIWWRFTRPTVDLYEAIDGLKRVMVTSLVNNHLAFAFQSTSPVFAHKLAVFSFDCASSFSVLQSSLHYHWAWEYSSTMRRDINYSPSDCFETFPFPENCDGLDSIGEQYNGYRQSIMQTRSEGLTKIYNRFHDPEEKGTDIWALRRLHIEMDQAVASAYQWTNLDLGHGIHETKQGTRYTISEAARRELLDRLLALNHQRHAEEEATTIGLAAVSKAITKRRSKPRTDGGKALNALFDLGEAKYDER
jgi:hypothetical protein